MFISRLVGISPKSLPLRSVSRQVLDQGACRRCRANTPLTAKRRSYNQTGLIPRYRATPGFNSLQEFRKQRIADCRHVCPRRSQSELRLWPPWYLDKNRACACARLKNEPVTAWPQPGNLEVTFFDLASDGRRIQLFRTVVKGGHETRTPVARLGRQRYR